MPARPEVNNKLREEYLKIYFLKYFMNYSWWQLCQEFSCSQWKIQAALKWVNDRFLKIPPKDLLRGAIFAIEKRLQENTKLWQKEIHRRKKSIRSIVELNREIREDMKHLQNLQSIYREHYEITGQSALTAAEVLRLIQGKSLEKDSKKEH